MPGSGGPECGPRWAWAPEQTQLQQGESELHAGEQGQEKEEATQAQQSPLTLTRREAHQEEGRGPRHLPSKAPTEAAVRAGTLDGWGSGQPWAPSPLPGQPRNRDRSDFSCVEDARAQT